MYNKGSKKTYYKKNNLAKIIFFIIIFVIVTKNVTVLAEDNNLSNNKSYKDFYMSIIKNTVSFFKVVGENKDDKKEFYDITSIRFTPMELISREINVINVFKGNNRVVEDNNIKQVKANDGTVDEAYINPFKLSDSSIKKQEGNEKVVTVGNPSDNSKKKILIYHTHTNEGYSGDNKTVVNVGNALTEELQKYGFTIIHDKTVHDTNYNMAYYKSRETLKKYQSQYGDFDLIIDLHRDSGPDKENVTGIIKNEKIAKLMMVTATEDPRYKSHNNIMNSIINIGNKIYPGLFREKSIFTYLSGITYYNQDLSDNAVLIEVGAASNTGKEAETSMKYLGEVLANFIANKK